MGTTTLAMAATAERKPAVTERGEKATKEEKEAKEASANAVCPRVIVTNKPAAPTTMAMAATAERRPVVTEKATKEAREKATKEAREKGARAKDANSNGQRDGAITTPAAPTTTVSAVSATNQATMIKSLLCTDATFDAS